MKKTAIIFIFFTFITNGCRQKINTPKDPNTYDKGVVINGIKWATRNVDEAGTFAPTPESTGKFYQWNRKTAWNGTDKAVDDWDNSIPEGTEWEEVNDPCPNGWRVPTMEELNSLKSASRAWKTRNGVNGFLFGGMFNQIFLPAAGYRDLENGVLYGTNFWGIYWSSTFTNEWWAWDLRFFRDYGKPQLDLYRPAHRAGGYCIRCVEK